MKTPRSGWMAKTIETKCRAKESFLTFLRDYHNAHIHIKGAGRYECMTRNYSFNLVVYVLNDVPEPTALRLERDTIAAFQLKWHIKNRIWDSFKFRCLSSLMAEIIKIRHAMVRCYAHGFL